MKSTKTLLATLALSTVLLADRARGGMKKSIIINLISSLTVVWVLSFVTPANAALVHFNSNLSQAWQKGSVLFPTGGTGSLATGTLTFDYDTDANLAFNIHISVQGLSIADLTSGNETHIHLPFQTQVLIDVGAKGLVDVPGGFESSNSGSEVISDDFETALLSGQSWINVHTQSHPLGEIMGVVTPVPVPTAAWLLGSGLLGLIGVARRKVA